MVIPGNTVLVLQFDCNWWGVAVQYIVWVSFERDSGRGDLAGGMDCGGREAALFSAEVDFCAGRGWVQRSALPYAGGGWDGKWGSVGTGTINAGGAPPLRFYLQKRPFRRVDGWTRRILFI